MQKQVLTSYDGSQAEDIREAAIHWFIWRVFQQIVTCMAKSKRVCLCVNAVFSNSIISDA